MHLRQKARLRPKLSPKFLSILGPNPIRKARPDLQRCLRLKIFHGSKQSNRTGTSISGHVDRASATETVDSGSIPGRVKSKTIKIGIHSFPAGRSAIKETV